MRATTHKQIGVAGKATAKIVPARPGRRRLVAVGDASLPRRVHITVDLSDGEDAKRFVYQVRNDKRKTTDSLLTIINEIAGVAGPSRDRKGNMQPRVPRRLRDRFKVLAKEAGFGSGSEYLREYIEAWINPRTGKRRIDKVEGSDRRPRLLGPRKSEDFVARGKELIDQARQGIGGEDLDRYSFDAGRSKAAVIEMAKGMHLSLSQFFSALIERSCIALEKGLNDTRV